MQRGENKKPQTKCICGEYGVQIIDHVASTFPAMGEFNKQRIVVGRCKRCGIMRQLAPPHFTEKEYLNYYQKDYPPTSDKYVAKDFAHDYDLAKKRCRAYKIEGVVHSKVLDVGSGSGAFVEYCRNLGMDAYGCEISKYAYARPSEDSYIYRDRLEDVHFPTDHFDIVTCHDVVEHVLDPIQFIREMFRVLKQGGTCFIDFPRFFHQASRHHWKPEHVWYFSVDDLNRILGEIGFNVEDIQIEYPIESKVVFRITKPEQARPSILVPPGIGDSYWTLIKLESFLRSRGLGLPDVNIICVRDRKYDGHKRSVPFLKLFPFLHCTGRVIAGGPDKSMKKIWNEAYGERGRTIFKNICGNDFFIAYNGHLRFGAQMEDVNPELECNWDLPMFVSMEQRRFQEECEERFGQYIIFYFVFQGTYKYWTKQFPVEEVIRFINHTTERTGCVPVFAGAIWDKQTDRLLQRVQRSVPGSIDMTGKTSVEQLFGMIKGSEAVIGYPSGLTIMSAAMKHPTFTIWNRFYHKDFAWYACPPDVKNKTYFIDDTKDYEIGRFVDKAVMVAGRGKGEIQEEENVVDSTSIRVIESVLPESEIGKLKFQPPARVTVVCVLKSGGDFTVDYVRRLHNMIKRNSTVPFRFVCLTDTDVHLDGCNVLKLKDNFPKWWSKVELFRPDLFKSEYVIYFDLDTVIVSNIDSLLRMEVDFAALQPWNPQNRKNGYFASGLMLWKNERYSFLYKEFDVKSIDSFPVGDQQYMSEALEKHKEHFQSLQDRVPGIYSFKRNCRSGLPKGARIICFHGKPRPADIGANWAKSHWR